MSGQSCGWAAQTPAPSHAPVGFWQKLPAAQSPFDLQAVVHAPWCATEAPARAAWQALG
jgi:hypothetical protein